MASPPAARARWSPSRKQIGIDLVFDVAFLLVLALHHLRVRADLLLPLGQLRVDLREAILLLLGDARHGLQRGRVERHEQVDLRLRHPHRRRPIHLVSGTGSRSRRR
ncbi:Os01g0566200 [Oryza sativa Japonica Group]|uniref:Os01g0566200 protein n=2 Tax=Oryza sativa subsp. japonica TaxID=39947 RepID=Q0JLV2_ORYSJ|nr:Os01g0566200 [Oryza sativa Japonica Group]BAS72755.1 Os01g0566200 [Oryza sativa Japonica Group]|eukprot:NP_001043362.1 Os01g0566200 [Oryza sativa Japonica Group]